MKHLLLTALGAALLCGCASHPDPAPAPAWLEADSVAAIDARIRADFPYTVAQFAAILAERYPDYDSARLAQAIDRRYVETMVIDDTLRVFRKALRNIGLLDPALNGGWTSRNFDASPQRIAEVRDELDHPDRVRRFTYTFSIDVPYAPELAGDTLHVWMPVPIRSDRQDSVVILETSLPDYVLSEGRSVHNTIYMSAPAPAAPGDTAHFSYTGRYDVRALYRSPAYIRSHIRPYDRESELYRTYTAFEEPHIVRLDSLARAIAGSDTASAYDMSERVYDYIQSTYPWAGAREYSTIGCIPRYVVAEGHGDCGQVALLYISLMRSLGVPARWESGWMLHPGEQNYHDWAEVYYEGVGWVPVDVSFGRYANASDPAVRDFYSTGMDAWRFATNTGVHGTLFPAKEYLRSETVDLQAGEVECSRGNLYWPAWSHKLDIISSETIRP